MDSPGSREFAGAVTTFSMAGFLWWSNRSLDVGTAGNMGPGYVPHLLSILLAICGTVLLARAANHGRGMLAGFADTAWPRALNSIKILGLVLGAVVLFALLIKNAGLAIAAFVTALVVSRASTDTTWAQSAIIALGLSVFSIVLFYYLLNLPMRVFPVSWN